jgi:Ca2+/H+ antiporter, TMEM165/GDT1 family
MGAVLVNLAVIATAFAVVFPAELPDKTALASLVLGSRYRPVFAFAGVAAAFTVHVVLAVAAGSLLGLLPRRPLEAAAAALFAAGAVLVLRQRRAHSEEHTEVAAEQRGFWRAFGTSFLVILVAEFGDLTQVATATLAARYHDPFSVGIGALLALWAVAALGIVSGRELLKVIPLRWISRAAAAIMLALAGVSLAAAVS